MSKFAVQVILWVDDDGPDEAAALATSILEEAGGSEIERAGSFGFAIEDVEPVEVTPA